MYSVMMRSTPLRGTLEYMKTQITFSIEEDNLEVLDWIARDEERSRSSLINKILTDWIDQQKYI